MKKIILFTLLSMTFAMGQIENIWATPTYVKQEIKIIDIRTPREWKETGIIKGSYLMMFFDEKGHFNLEAFLLDLNKIIKKDEKFALICRVGSRTNSVANFLSSKLNYNVVNLKGGIMKIIKEGYKTVPYPLSSKN